MDTNINTSVSSADNEIKMLYKGHVIGFASKFYTLWYANKRSLDLGGGKTVVVTEYSYIKKISTSKETAIEKYPGATIDENLRGKTRSWAHSEYVWDNIDTFRFGKYNGGVIADNSDTSYIVWYYGCVDGDHREHVAEILRSRGYVVNELGCISPEEQKEMAAAEAEKNRLIAMADSGECINLFIESNPSEEGYVFCDNRRYRFREVAERYYDGYAYYMPCKNGKAKRVKNKTISALVSYNRGDDEFVIEEFDVLKEPKSRDSES